MVERPVIPFLPRQVPVGGYRDRFFHFGGMSHAGSITALPSGVRPWRPESVEDLTAEDFSVIVADAPAFELLLIGTGRDPAPLRAPLKQILRECGLRFDVMSTPAAASTYNILLDEGRPVGAALIAV